MLFYIVTRALCVVVFLAFAAAMLYFCGFSDNIIVNVLGFVVVIVGLGGIFCLLPHLYPDSKEHDRLWDEYKCIAESLESNPEISVDLYNRMVTFNQDNDAYNKAHSGLSTVANFDIDSFSTKCRVVGMYDDYTVYINGVEVSMEDITLYLYGDRPVEVNDDNKTIHIAG